MAQDYTTAEAVADHLVEPAMLDGGNRERLLVALVSRASRLIDAWFGYREGAWKAEELPSVRLYPGTNSLDLWPDFMAAAPTLVEVAEAGDITAYTTWLSTEYYPWPSNALLDGRPYRCLKLNPLYTTKAYWYGFGGLPTVRITCRWGYSIVVPPMIEEACIVQVGRWYKRGEQAFQDAGAITDLMQMRYLKKLDPEVELLLGRMPGGVTI